MSVIEVVLLRMESYYDRRKSENNVIEKKNMSGDKAL